MLEIASRPRKEYFCSPYKKSQFFRYSIKLSIKFNQTLSFRQKIRKYLLQSASKWIQNLYHLIKKYIRNKLSLEAPRLHENKYLLNLKWGSFLVRKITSSHRCFFSWKFLRCSAIIGLKYKNCFSFERFCQFDNFFYSYIHVINGREMLQTSFACIWMKIAHTVNVFCLNFD